MATIPEAYGACIHGLWLVYFLSLIMMLSDHERFLSQACLFGTQATLQHLWQYVCCVGLCQAIPHGYLG